MPSHTFTPLALLAILSLLTSLSLPAQTLPTTPTLPLPLPLEPHPLRIAVIGDYGIAGPPEASVAALIASLAPDLLFTVGDNNYPLGELATIDANIGQYYHSFISPYLGLYGSGSPTNRFFPALGNHDWYSASAAAYFAYFTLPNNERYYSVHHGPLHALILDSDPNEPDGITSTSPQAQWLQSELAASSAPFKLVLFHHAPHSSGATHGSEPSMQWPFRAWGASAVLAGHEHDYERLLVQGLPYFVNGLGGQVLYNFGLPLAGSQMRFNADHGAQLIDIDPSAATFQFLTQSGVVIDGFSMGPNFAGAPETALLPLGSTWKFLDTGVSPPANWTSPTFDDSTWSFGPAQLGYGDGDEASVLDYGPDLRAKHITTWFRLHVQVPDPSLFSALELRVLRDDGCVVHLNGSEVLRSNMPAGAITAATLAATSVNDSPESSLYAAELPANALVPGDNTVAVEVHQILGTSSDLSFDMELVGVAPGQLLVATTAVWKYWDQGVAPARPWAEPDFDDSSWPAGPAQLGYGEGDEATVVGYGPDPANKHVTTLFRRAFDAGGTASLNTLLLKISRDDGCVVYLNGAEAWRSNLPYGALGASTLAPYPIGSADENVMLETSLDPGLLRDGRNVIAVELHQNTVVSSDLSFALELRAH